MKLSGLLFFLLFSLQTFAEFPLWDEPSRKFKQGLWELQSQLTYFQATSNYTKDGGSFTSLPSGSDYHLMTVDFGVHYGLSKKWGAFVTSQIANAESKTTGSSVAPIAAETRTQSSLTQMVAGTDYLFYTNGKTELFSDLSLTIPFKKVTAQSDDVLNNEGAMELSARLIARQQWRAFGFFAFGGYTYRDEGRSGLVPYGVGSEWNLKALNLGAELRGYQTMLNDQYSNEPSRRQIVAAKNGYSLKFYSVDQSLLETHFWLRSNGKNQIAWKTGGGMTITGASAAAGWNLFVGLSYNFSPDTNASTSTTSEPPPLQPQPEIERFEEDISDDANQNYFTKPPPPPVPKPVSPKSQKQQIQKNLDQLEFQIELKRKKPAKKKKRSR